MRRLPRTQPDELRYAQWVIFMLRTETIRDGCFLRVLLEGTSITEFSGAGKTAIMMSLAKSAFNPFA